MRRCLFFGILAILICAALPAQDAGVSLRRGFRETQLGSSLQQTQETLQADSAFYYRGPADVSLLPSDGEYVIDSTGRGFVERGLFQFYEGELYSIAIYIDRRQLDYFQLFEQLRGRYGDPMDLDPQRAIWEDGTTRIQLERPLTVRYLDLITFLDRRNETRRLDSAAATSRDQFLSEF